MVGCLVTFCTRCWQALQNMQQPCALTCAQNANILYGAAEQECQQLTQTIAELKAVEEQHQLDHAETRQKLVSPTLLHNAKFVL